MTVARQAAHLSMHAVRHLTCDTMQPTGLQNTPLLQVVLESEGKCKGFKQLLELVFNHHDASHEVLDTSLAIVRTEQLQKSTKEVLLHTLTLMLIPQLPALLGERERGYTSFPAT